MSEYLEQYGMRASWGPTKQYVSLCPGLSLVETDQYQLAMRARPNFNPTHYSVEWANVLTSYLKKQLGEITLPMARPGLNVKQTFKGVLNDPETRERWTNRFSYRQGPLLHVATYLVLISHSA